MLYSSICKLTTSLLFQVGPSMKRSEASTVWWCVAAILLVSGAPGWARPQASSGEFST